MAADYNGLDYGSAQLLVRHLRMHPLKMKRCLDRENRELNLETAQSSVSDPDPLFPNVDSRIRIRIHVKMRWIRNAGAKCVQHYDIFENRELLLCVR